MSLSALDVAAANRALAEGSTFRAVRRARLVLPDREAEFATRAALEDALRTADFSDAGRLIVVRRLALKGLPRGATGAQIARALELAWKGLAPSAVAFDAPGAHRADIVYFRCLHEARLAWLKRFADRGAPTEWFWPRALPEIVDQPAPAALVSLLVALQTTAPRALAEAVGALPQTASRRLLDALPAARIDALLPPPPMAAHVATPNTHADQLGDRRSALRPTEGRAAPRDRHDAQPGVPKSSTSPNLHSKELRERLAFLRSAFGASDWRLVWFAGQVARAITGETPFAQIVAALTSSEAAQTVEAPPAADAPDHMASPSAPSWRDGASMPAESNASAALVRQAASAPIDDGLLPHALPRAAARDGLSARYPWLNDSRSTAFGGLLMLLNAIEVLRFPAWLNAQPARIKAHFGRALLTRIARRLRVPSDDPQQALLLLDDRAQEELREAACHWQDFRWPRGFDARNIQPASPVIPVGESLWRWQCALARLLRRNAGLGIAHVVSRCAGVSVTPTHVDIVLPLADADTALRRTGLDRDPGWVPWFGWIVAFHYLEERRDAAG